MKRTKPFWNETLTELWNTVRQKERDYLKCRDSNNIRSKKRQEYKRTRNLFDSISEAPNGLTDEQKILDIENTVSRDPNEFWPKINKLGPRKSSSVPCEVIDKNGQDLKDRQSVLDTWKENSQVYITVRK